MAETVLGERNREIPGVFQAECRRYALARAPQILRLCTVIEGYQPISEHQTAQPGARGGLSYGGNSFGRAMAGIFRRSSGLTRPCTVMTVPPSRSQVQAISGRHGPAIGKEHMKSTSDGGRFLRDQTGA